MKKKLSSICIIILIGLIAFIGIKIYKNAPSVNDIYGETEISGLEVNDLDYEYGYFKTTGGDPYICIPRFGEYIRSVTVDFENAQNLDSITLYYGNPAIKPENQKTVWLNQEYGCIDIRLYKNASSLRLDLNPIEGEEALVRINAIRVSKSYINRWLVCGMLIIISVILVYLTDIYTDTLGQAVIKLLILAGILLGIAINLPAAPDNIIALIVLYVSLGGMIICFDRTDGYTDRIFWVLLILAAAIIMCLEAVNMPYNYGPDEDMHMDVCRYIYAHHSLPDATNPEIINEMFGFSYALFPITSFIISAVFMIAGDSFLEPETLYIAARFSNVLLSVITIILLIAIAKKIFVKPFDRLFVMSIAFLPQFLFVSAYVNSDAFGLMTVALITWLMIWRREKNWNTKSCIFLGLAIGLCLLSYYNCYGMIMVAAGFAVCTFCIDRMGLSSLQIDRGCHIAHNSHKNNIQSDKATSSNKEKLLAGLIRAIGITAVSALLVSAWWFIRNGILYDGDILGFATKDRLQELYAWEELKPAARITDYNSGLSIFDTLFDKGWIVKSCKSYIMSYGYMSVWLKEWVYILSAVVINILLIGNLVCIKREKLYQFSKIDGEAVNIQNSNDKTFLGRFWVTLLYNRMFEISMILVCLITIAMALTYSYFSDFQPQGRYLLPMYIGFAYILIRGLGKLWLVTKSKLKDIILWLFFASLIALELLSLFVGVFIDCVNVL